MVERYMTALRSRGRPRKASKSQIVENAMALYWHDGLSTRSLNELCRQLDLSKPGLYREFGGEDGLIAECLSLYGQTVRDAFGGIINDGKPFQVQVDNFIDKIFALHKQFPQGCLLMQATREQRDLGQASLRAMQSESSDLFQMILLWVQKAKRQGAIASNVTAKVASSLILAQVHCVHSGLVGGLTKDLVRELSDLSLQSILRPHRLH